MQFESFAYGKKVHPRTEVKALLVPACDSVIQGVLRTGNAINGVLA